MSKEKLTQKRLSELLSYNPNTGIFIRKIGLQCVKKGDVAGTPQDGYIKIKVDGCFHFAHRLAWLYSYGYSPENQIDHINRIRNDNRLCNLREVSHQCNCRNRSLQVTNTSGIKGVSWDKSDNKWRAYISTEGTRKYIGRYEDFDDAVCARLSAEQCLDWSNCESSSPAYKYVKENIFL